MPQWRQKNVRSKDPTEALQLPGQARDCQCVLHGKILPTTHPSCIVKRTSLQKLRMASWGCASTPMFAVQKPSARAAHPYAGV